LSPGKKKENNFDLRIFGHVESSKIYSQIILIRSRSWYTFNINFVQILFQLKPCLLDRRALYYQTSLSHGSSISSFNLESQNGHNHRITESQNHRMV